MCSCASDELALRILFSPGDFNALDFLVAWSNRVDVNDFVGFNWIEQSIMGDLFIVIIDHAFWKVFRKFCLRLLCRTITESRLICVYGQYCYDRCNCIFNCSSRAVGRVKIINKCVSKNVNDMLIRCNQTICFTSWVIHIFL